MFNRASKENIKIRLALSGSSGSGKTYSSLAIATNLGKSVALIDTEKGSASRYADLFEFDVCELVSFHPAKYIEAIKAAGDSGYETIIIDSLSHAWLAQLEIVDKSKNKFTAWSPVRELERQLIQAIITSPAHIIATMRSKTEWDTTQVDRNGKMKPTKVGTAPIQNAGIEYEFDIAGELNQEHTLYISKSRCPEVSNRSFLNPGKDLADELLTWIRPWHNWKNEKDAILWAQKQKPGLSVDTLEQAFANLETNGGKKATAWVRYVKQLN